MKVNKFFNKMKAHALTAISYLIPIVVAGGFLLAIGNLLGGEELATEVIKNTNFSYADTLTTMGILILSMLPMIISTGISYSIADKPGVAPGFLVGMIAINMEAGFIGGFIGGYVAGYTAKVITEKLSVPEWAEGMKPMLLIPFISSIIVGGVMYYVLGIPISSFQNILNEFLRGLDPTQTILFGATIGILSGIDYGGPINKITFAFLLTLQSEGITEPMAVLMLASMVTPFGFTLAYYLQKIFNKNIYTQMEVETLKTAFPMGVVMITEGCFPIVFNDLWKSILSTGIGAAVGGAISMTLGAGSPVPHGGLFAMVTMTNPLAWFISLIIGSIITGVVFFILKSETDYDAVKIVSESDEQDIDMGQLTIS